MEHIGISAGFRTCICPVCGIPVHQDQISHHVELHFAGTTTQDHSQQMDFSNYSSNSLHGASTAVNAGSSWDDSANEDMRMCNYEGCQDLVFASEWDDHTFAHMLEDQDDAELMSLATGQSLSLSSGLVSQQYHQQQQHQETLNDSLLAQLTQQELDSALETDVQLHDDWLLAHDLEKEQQKLKEEQEFRKLQEMCGMLPNQGGFKKQYEKKLKQDTGKMKMSVGEYYARKADMYETLMTGHDSKESQTQGLISCLQANYSNGISGIRTVQLCLETDHFASGVGDAGWGCGYRNTQMILSSLLRSNTFKDIVAKGMGGYEVPSIPKIQSMIEDAWKKGFDAQGAEQLGNKLHNTSKWIGATEIAVLLRSLRIKAELVDFHTATGHDGTHPKMFTWIHRYYNQEVGTRESPPPPLFLQHQGHSRLCIGVEEHPRGECPIYLLLFDPSHAPRQMKALIQNVSSNVSAQLRLLRRSLKQMRSKQYQILHIDGIYEDDAEFEQSKEFHSVRVP